MRQPEVRYYSPSFSDVSHVPKYIYIYLTYLRITACFLRSRSFAFFFTSIICESLFPFIFLVLLVLLLFLLLLFFFFSLHRLFFTFLSFLSVDYTRVSPLTESGIFVGSLSLKKKGKKISHSHLRFSTRVFAVYYFFPRAGSNLLFACLSVSSSVVSAYLNGIPARAILTKFIPRDLFDPSRDSASFHHKDYSSYRKKSIFFFLFTRDILFLIFYRNRPNFYRPSPPV